MRLAAAQPTHEQAAETRNGVLRFCFPIAAAKLALRGQVPLQRLCRVFRYFKMTAKFERHHRVVGFFIEQKKLSSRISAATGAPNSGRNLFPIRHKGAGYTYSPSRKTCRLSTQPVKKKLRTVLTPARFLSTHCNSDRPRATSEGNSNYWKYGIRSMRLALTLTNVVSILLPALREGKCFAHKQCLRWWCRILCF